MWYFTFFCFILSVCDLVCVLHLTAHLSLDSLPFMCSRDICGWWLHDRQCIGNTQSSVSGFFLLKSYCCCWIHSSYFEFIPLDLLSEFSKLFFSFSTLCLLAYTACLLPSQIIHLVHVSSLNGIQRCTDLLALWRLPIFCIQIFNISMVYITSNILRQTCAFNAYTCVLSLGHHLQFQNII